MFSMIQFNFDTRLLAQLARRRRMPYQANDVGYATHCALGELFGDEHPKPFVIDRQQGRFVRILAYSDRSLETLREHAVTFSEPELFELCNWNQAFEKPMPNEWRKGRELGFQIVTIPVERDHYIFPEEGERYLQLGGSKQKEVDAFLVHKMTKGTVFEDRETIYGRWLHRQFPDGSSEITSVRMSSFNFVNLVRRTQGEKRKSMILKRPMVTLQGRLKILNPEEFGSVVRWGVGRHRAFGYGMLLLKP